MRAPLTTKDQLRTELAAALKRAERAEARFAHFVNPDTLAHSINDSTAREWDLCNEVERIKQKMHDEGMRAVSKLANVTKERNKYKDMIDKVIEAGNEIIQWSDGPSGVNGSVAADKAYNEALRKWNHLVVDFSFSAS